MPGSCKACGECCKWLVYSPATFSYDLKHIEIRGGKIVHGAVLFYHPCPELSEDGKCKIFETRPRFCRSGYEENYDVLEKLGCRFNETVQDDPNVLKIHMTEVTGAFERIH